MQKKRQVKWLITGLIVSLIILLGIEFNKRNDFMGMPMITEEKAAKLEAEYKVLDRNISDDILYNEGSIAYDTDSKTIYVSQNSEETWYGILSTVQENARLYWLADEAFADKKEAVQQGHIFTFYYVTDEGYVKGNLIATGLPVLSFQKETSEKLEYQGNIRMIDSDDADENIYSSKTSYARVKEKVKSTNLYEREYRIHLLKDDKKTKQNVDLLGLGKNDDWELHSLFMDNSMVREKLVDQLWNEVIQENTSQSEYGMQMEYVEVVMNGRYIGIYALSEHADHKSLGLQEGDLVMEDSVSNHMADTATQNEENYLNYSVFMQCIDGVRNINEKKTIIARKVEETKSSPKIELFRIPDKLENIMESSRTEILEDAELQQMAEKNNQEDLLWQSERDYYQRIRQEIFTEAAVTAKIKVQREYLVQSGAIVREHELRKNENVEEGMKELQNFLKDRLDYLDTYYGGIDSIKVGNSPDSRTILQENTTKKTDVYRADTLNTGIPTVYLAIDGGEESIEAIHSSKENQAYGSVFIDVPTDYTGEYSNITQGDYSGNLEYIRCRGQSSFASDKKSYKMKLAEKADLFGMGASKDWILLANCYDESMLRNKLAYWFADEIGMEFTPKSVYVNVVINGVKMGCYLLEEQIKVAENRVELSEPDENTDTMQYSYLVEIAPEGRAIREDGYMVAPYSKECFLVRYPKELAVDSEYYQNIAMDLLHFDQMLYAGEDYSLRELEKYVDIDSVIDYFWVQEIFKNTDAMYASTFFYQDVNGRITFGPIWDFDLAIGTYAGEGASMVSGWYVRNLPYYEKLFQNTEFAERAMKRYKEIRPELALLIENNGTRKSVMNMYIDQLGEAREQNVTMWGVEKGWKREEDVFIKQDSIQAADDYISSWMQQHIAWMDENLDTLLIGKEAENENING